MKITVCIGSSCHLKGSRLIVKKWKELIDNNNLADKIELNGTFCMGKCQKSVCVTIDDEFFSVAPSDAEKFFEEVILKRV